MIRQSVWGVHLSSNDKSLTQYVEQYLERPNHVNFIERRMSFVRQSVQERCGSEEKSVIVFDSTSAGNKNIYADVRIPSSSVYAVLEYQSSYSTGRVDNDVLDSKKDRRAEGAKPHILNSDSSNAPRRICIVVVLYNKLDASSIKFVLGAVKSRLNMLVEGSNDEDDEAQADGPKWVCDVLCVSDGGVSTAQIGTRYTNSIQQMESIGTCISKVRPYIALISEMVAYGLSDVRLKLKPTVIAERGKLCGNALSNLPKLSDREPLVAFHGFEKGDVVEFRRGVHGEERYRRIVVDHDSV